VDIQKKIKADIERVGWSVVSVFSDGEEPGFSYTIGLSRTFSHPEIIVFGIPPEAAHGMCSSIVKNTLRKGGSAIPGPLYDNIADGYGIRFIRVDSAFRDQRMLLLKLCYDDPRKVLALQMVWPDPDNKFPWEAGFDHRYDLAQPLLGKVPLVQ